MRIVFAGTPAFAAACLAAVLDDGHTVVQVLTQPDRPSGRGMKPQPREVKALALSRGLPVAQPPTLRDAGALAALRALDAEAMVVAAYGLLLPQAVLDSFPLGCLNVHASLLPRWRGAAPIQRALLAGDEHTGICIMQMEAGLDTGPVLLARSLPIGPRDTGASLHDRLASLGAATLCEALRALEQGPLPATPQAASGVTYAARLAKEEAELDWAADAQQLDRQVRAFNPFPVARTHRGEELLRVWEAQPAHGRGEPGEIIAVDDTAVEVACGSGSLRLQVLQRAGGRPLPVREFLRGTRLQAGMRLGG